MSRLYKLSLSPHTVKGIINAMTRMGVTYDYQASLSLTDESVSVFQFHEDDLTQKKVDFDLVTGFPQELMETCQVGFDAFYMHYNEMGRDLVSERKFRVKPDGWTRDDTELPPVELSEFSFIQKMRLAILSGYPDRFKTVLNNYTISDESQDVVTSTGELWALYNWVNNPNALGDHLPSISDLYHIRYGLDIEMLKAEIQWAVEQIERSENKEGYKPS